MHDAHNPQADIDMTHRLYGSDLPTELIEQWELTRLEMQEDLVGLSTKAQLIVVPGTSFFIPGEEPQAIVDAVQDLLSVIRGE